MSRTLPWIACSLLLACGGAATDAAAPAEAPGAAPDALVLRTIAGRGHGHHGGASADDRHCVLPWGPDLNAVLDTDVRIVTGPGGCPVDVLEHERFAPLLVFWFNFPAGLPEVPLAYPAGYLPSHPDPLRDFLSRLGSITHVVQPGGRAFTFTARQVARSAEPSTIGAVFGGSGQFPDTWSPLRARVTLPQLPGLKAGDYTIDSSITFDEAWCDGTDADPALACFPAGTTPLGSRPLPVKPRR